MRPSRGVPLFLLSVLLFSCAGPAQLARQSQRELDAGNLDKAYELARRAVDKGPEHSGARRAMATAAAQLVDARKAQVFAVAAVDTLAGARHALRLRELRGELARYQVELPEDPGYFERERRIVDGAAAIEYAQGESDLAAGRPKLAYRHYREAESFVASYGDLQDKIRLAHSRGMTRVAVMPFEDDVEVPGLSRALTDQVVAAIAGRLLREGFEFTELVSPDEIYAAMTVKEMDALTPESVWRIAHGVEASRVVMGRVHGLRASTNTWSFHYPIYRKTTVRDTSGKSIVRWISIPFDAVAQERLVKVQWDMQVLDARTRAALADRSETVERAARVAWTDFRAEGDCGDYHLVPADEEGEERGKAVLARWRECFGGWALSDMLRRARDERRRALYQASYRDEFRADSRRRPVLCGELPSENDMATLALEDLWRPALVMLKELDARD